MRARHKFQGLFITSALHDELLAAGVPVYKVIGNINRSIDPTSHNTEVTVVIDDSVPYASIEAVVLAHDAVQVAADREAQRQLYLTSLRNAVNKLASVAGWTAREKKAFVAHLKDWVDGV